jgi:hypothetical protein
VGRYPNQMVLVVAVEGYGRPRPGGAGRTRTRAGLAATARPGSSRHRWRGARTPARPSPVRAGAGQGPRARGPAAEASRDHVRTRTRDPSTARAGSRGAYAPQEAGGRRSARPRAACWPVMPDVVDPDVHRRLWEPGPERWAPRSAPRRGRSFHRQRAHGPRVDHVAPPSRTTAGRGDRRRRSATRPRPARPVRPARSPPAARRSISAGASPCFPFRSITH